MSATRTQQKAAWSWRGSATATATATSVKSSTITSSGHAPSLSWTFWAYHVLVGGERRSLLFVVYRRLYRWFVGKSRRGRSSTSSSPSSSSSSASGCVLELDVLSPSRSVTARGVAGVVLVAAHNRSPAPPIVSAGGLEEDEPGLRALFAVDVARLSAEQLRTRMEDAQRAFVRQNARLAHLRSARKRALQVGEAEAQLRSCAEHSVAVLEAELARLRKTNAVLADQLHARQVQLSRLGDAASLQATPRTLVADAAAVVAAAAADDEELSHGKQLAASSDEDDGDDDDALDVDDALESSEAASRVSQRLVYF